MAFAPALATLLGPIVLAEGSLIEPEPGLAFWTVVTFLVVAVVLRWKVWGPLMSMIDEREKSIQESVDEARKQREEAEKLLAAQQAAIQDARREAGEMLRRSQADIEKARDEALARARKDAEDLVAKARQQIGEEKVRAIAEVRDTAADLAISVASKLLSRSLDDAAHRKLAEDFVAQVESQPRREPGQA